MGVDLLPQDHKLCGFLCAVLTTTLPQDKDPVKALAFGTPCQIFGDGCDVGFRTEDGVVLSLIDPNARALIAVGDSTPSDREKTRNLERESVAEGKSIASSSSKKKWSRIGLVHGSISVVHQLYALVTYKCLSIDSSVVRVFVGNCGEVRVLVLVDVYLPIALWSGWQFPRAGSMAAVLFRHLSCDWGARCSMLESNKLESEHKSDSAWNLCDCHVLNCKQNCSPPNASRKKLFELHEIFKSLPSVTKRDPTNSSRINPSDKTSVSGIWDLSDDILINILTTLTPPNLLSVSATCHHLRFLASSVMPCMKLKLFPHQHAAVEWMLKRERDSKVLPHPLYKDFVTEDGFAFYINCVTGEILTGTIPTIRDFNGGMFCDEPGLGKTITALSLILKTQGTLADPPSGAQVVWCTHDNKKCGYYELASEKFSETTRRGQFFQDKLRTNSPVDSNSTLLTVQSTKSWSRSIKKNLMHTYGGEPGKKKSGRKRDDFSYMSQSSSRKKLKTDHFEEYNETWVQCDACRKWRKLLDESMADNTKAWFCSMNKDHFHQSCSVPEESWDFRQPVTYLPGFYTKGTSGGKEENVTFFTSVLKEHCSLVNCETKKALTWLAKLSPDKLSKMETNGLLLPLTEIRVMTCGGDFHKIFQAFGLVKRVEKGTTKWYYPKALVNLTFDLDALKIALCEPFNSVRLYLSRTTLVVVPSNLVDHWKTQIEKHVRTGQLRVYVWIDSRKPTAHNLAWDYDVVITTFSRLSAEWSPRKRSVLMQIHWLRVMFDEGHTLGSSLNLTNKLQISVSLTTSNRWLLTGTPTPNTPNSQLSHLQPMLKFLREEAYGQNQKSWESGILRPFEAEMEDGRSRLLNLLSRCMISARKSDLHMIPPCIKKAKFLDFTEEHARSYNELVVTVRRNILMADWNDPSHVESLLNPKQWKFRSNTIRNVRLSCCVAGHIKVTDAGEDIQETLDILVENGLDPVSEEYALIRFNLLHGGNCARCKEWCRLPVITPCRHLLCLDCVGLDSERCTFPGCGNLYEIQSPEILTRPENPNPKWPVPKDLIELQPSYKQDDWNPDWQSTSSSKVSYLVHRLKELQEPNNQLVFLSQKPVEKVLIFSQFLEHIHVIEQQLRFAGINFVGMYSPMHSVNKMKSLSTFQHDDTCTVLLMDGSAALGLDLSFVTHVFLMEPIWDRSMEEQVISRAHRMGATRPINVETLAMRGTIEEQMLKFLMDADECRRFLKEEYVKNEHEGARAHRTFHDLAESNYLSQLNFVRTFSTHENQGA